MEDRDGQELIKEFTRDTAVKNKQTEEVGS